VIARLTDERNIIQKLTTTLARELQRQGHEVSILAFKKRMMLCPPLKRLSEADSIVVANVGLQCAYISLLKLLGLVRKQLVAISFGSDIREAKTNFLVKLWNLLSIKAVDILIPINPDLVPIAKKLGYKKVHYVHNWAGGIE
jgi:hypothetical protein